MRFELMPPIGEQLSERQSLVRLLVPGCRREPGLATSASYLEGSCFLFIFSLALPIDHSVVPLRILATPFQEEATNNESSNA